ncbi:MAG: 50S ribosomal protein L6 [Gammaproteobacteria bacterium]|nr:50S ribosomal protein L6 [Gammaproteobacteria bacterium]MBT7603559.1 50S ribosomal protein L6 [Gammaproteobacteria bacterium]
MSRIAKQPVEIPDNVEINIKDKTIFFKGPEGEISMGMHSDVGVKKEDKFINIEITENNSAIAGTIRALINNNVVGVSKGFEKKLNLVGVGYKAEVKNKELHLSLGFSHPVVYKYSEDVKIKTPSPTEININGIDKQKVGQVAAEIRAFRPPEPYKGKGVKYSDENIIRKEAKKK